MRTTIALFLVAAAAAAQAPTPPKKDAPKGVAPLPEGETKILQALVIEVTGTAQARGAEKDAKWADLKVNETLKPGARIRTGRKSRVTLRIGANATLLVDRQSRVTLPEIAQNGDVLKTRVGLKLGKADVRVDRVGLVNDFEVVTPTATLAVRGTAFRLWWDRDGFRSMGVPGNKLRSIEVRYLHFVKALLSGADSTSEAYPLPALEGFYETYLRPLEGAVSGPAPTDPKFPESDESETDPVQQTGLEAANQKRDDPQLQDPRGDNPPPPTDNPPPGQN